MVVTVHFGITIIIISLDSENNIYLDVGSGDGWGSGSHGESGPPPFQIRRTGTVQSTQ